MSWADTNHRMNITSPSTGTPGPELAPPALLLAEAADVVDLEPPTWIHVGPPRSR